MLNGPYMTRRRKPQRTDAGAALTELVLETFRLNGALVDAGNELTRPLGLTGARWQVMGAIDLERRSLTVSQIARKMGLTRQSVQRIVNELVKDSFLELIDNPRDRRAKLVGLTGKGEITMTEVDAAQALWINALSEDIAATEIRSALSLVREIVERLLSPDQSSE